MSPSDDPPLTTSPLVPPPPVPPPHPAATPHATASPPVAPPTPPRADRVVEGLAEELASVRVALERLRVVVEADARRREDHERRVRLLEGWQHRTTPLLGLITFLLGALVTGSLDWLR